MSELSFDNIYPRSKPKDQTIHYWRTKIKKTINPRSSQIKGRNQSCEIPQSPKQLIAMFQLLISENKKLKTELKNQENLLNIYNSYDFDEENSTKYSEDSSPNLQKSLDPIDKHLITFRPGEKWTDSIKPLRKKIFPREVFTVPKSNLPNIY